MATMREPSRPGYDPPDSVRRADCGALRQQERGHVKQLKHQLERLYPDGTATDK